MNAQARLNDIDIFVEGRKVIVRLQNKYEAEREFKRLKRIFKKENNCRDGVSPTINA